MQVAWDTPYTSPNLTPSEKLMNELYRTTTKLGNEDVYDSFLQVPLRDYLNFYQPSLLFVGYGETDNWAHSGRYDLVLESARGYDQFVQELWNLVQSIPEFRNETTFILTATTVAAAAPRNGVITATNEKGSEISGSPSSAQILLRSGERSNRLYHPIPDSATLAALLVQATMLPSREPPHHRRHLH